MLNVAVIYGGKSKEREVSLRSGKGVANALKAKGCNVKEIDFTSMDFISSLQGVDLVYLALHGRFGEDGRIQGLLDILEIPYVGSGVLASALAMDKAKAKRIFDYVGIRVAKDLFVQIEDKERLNFDAIEEDFGFPLVVKPNQEGSTIGLSIVKNKSELKEAINHAFTFDKQILIEEFISGTEVTVAVLETASEIQALPIIEIIPNKNQYYDYESKYAPGGSDHIIPARINKETEGLLKKWAIEAHRQLGCETLSRVDFIIPSDGSLPVILEVNTLPGMTETSLYPDAAKAIGLSYEDIVYKLVEITLDKQK
ncbi:D-alanine--D-alanine ligase [Tepidibacillus infernus]|uniref:D-alanine--D-alanine ligase n=1 Tax=Tepidibacillus decaturensis TaxID=1413211 RepID=A0A135L3D1_9BACI|nr:D-alanine--D-alanine ligase [Tepidibacillus decaturensis]KXG43379.1 D-alanine--D-alanine ligase [Tepidibacillus decaturensis]